jgi:hypothetical protein
MYDCKIKITDSKGSRCYYISALCDDENTLPPIAAEVFDNEFDLTLIPIMPDVSPAVNEIEENNWKDKLVKKASKLLFDTIEKVILRVGCRYRIDQIQDGDCLDIALQTYVFGTFDRYNLLELFPVTYMFFEVFQGNKRFNLITAFETNRKEVLRAARGITLAGALGIEFLLALIFVYPIQISRVKRLTKNKKISKILTKFNNLSDTKRQQFLDKQEKFMDS